MSYGEQMIAALQDNQLMKVRRLFSRSFSKGFTR